MSVYAYMRVSTNMQSTDNQKIAIREAGYAVDNWIAECGVSGAIRAVERPEFSRMLASVVKGDTVVVTALDRLGRDAEDILNTVNNFIKLGVRVCILALGNIDVTSLMGKLVITTLSAVAELERGMLKERTKQGMARTAEQGTFVGRPLALTPELLKVLIAGRESGSSYDYLAEKYSVSKMTIQRNVTKWAGKMDEYKAEWEKRNSQYAKES